MTSMTATEARRRLYALLETVADSHEPIQIKCSKTSRPSRCSACGPTTNDPAARTGEPLSPRNSLRF